MERRSRPDARFDRQCGWVARSFRRACLRVFRQIRPAPRILSQPELPPKKSILLYLLFSCSWSCSTRQRFRISLFKAETQLTLCDSDAGILRRRFQKTQAECLTESHQRSREKGNRTVTIAVRWHSSRVRFASGCLLTAMNPIPEDHVSVS